jgi:hypothetical protein
MMRFGFGKMLLGGALMGAVALAGAQVTKNGSGYLFRIKFIKGQKITYVMDTTSAMNGQKVVVKGTMGQTVTAVKGGIGTLKVDVADMKMTLNGKPFQNPTGSTAQSMEVRVDTRGQVQGSASGNARTSIPFPEKAVPLGGTWKNSSTVPVMGQPVQVVAVYKLVGFQKVGKFNTAKVAVTIKGSGKMKIAGTGTVWVNAADGTLVKNVNQITTPMAVTMTITRK